MPDNNFYIDENASIDDITYVTDNSVYTDDSKKKRLEESIENNNIVNARALIKQLTPYRSVCLIHSYKKTLTLKNKTMLMALVKELGEAFESDIIDTNIINDMSMLFSGTTNILPENLSCLDVTNVENMSLMFYKSDIDLSKAGLENWDVSKVRNMRWMMEDTPENRRIVQAWKDKGLLNKVINENEIFYAKQKH